MKKYIDKSAIIFGIGALAGAIGFTMFVKPKLPTSLGGGA